MKAYHFCSICGNWLMVEDKYLFADKAQAIVIVKPCCPPPGVAKELEELRKYKKSVEEVTSCKNIS